MTLEEILQEEDRKAEERLTQQRIERGEIPDPLAEVRAAIRACFSGPRIKARFRAPAPPRREARPMADVAPTLHIAE